MHTVQWGAEGEVGSKPRLPWQSNHIVFDFLEQEVIKQRAILTFKN